MYTHTQAMGLLAWWTQLFVNLQRPGFLTLNYMKQFFRRETQCFDGVTLCKSLHLGAHDGIVAAPPAGCSN